MLAADAPRGSLMEVHSCELYAGGCMVSSEEPQEGRYMLRAWNFTGGEFQGAQLKGLVVAALQSSPDNLAAADTKPGDAVVYLPDSATPAQREMLLSWLRAQPALEPAKITTRVVPLQFAKSGEGYDFSAGTFASVRTASLRSCPSGSCGESLWYEPRSAAGPFTVALDRSVQVSEPLLKLKWDQNDSRNIFLARFGEKTVASKSFVTLPELCGANLTLF